MRVQELENGIAALEYRLNQYSMHVYIVPFGTCFKDTNNSGKIAELNGDRTSGVQE